MKISGVAIHRFQDVLAGKPLSVRQGFVALYITLLYLCIGTGLHSDDYSFLTQVVEGDFVSTIKKIFSSSSYLYSTPAIFFDFVQFYYFGYSGIQYDIVKSLVAFFAIYSAWMFAKQYIDQGRALLFSTFFVLFPLHDAANYWTTGTYLLITGAWVMLSHVFVNCGRGGVGLSLGFLGAFWSYASPPLIAGLSITFLLRREYHKFWLFVLPEVLYVIYYFGISRWFAVGEFRTKDITHPLAILKQFTLQVGTFVDVSIGPSLWLKLYYSMSAIHIASLVVAGAMALLLIRIHSFRRVPTEKVLLASSFAVLIFGLLTMSLTGAMPQLAFNMGNRVTYFSCMFLAIILVTLMTNRRVLYLVALCFSLSVVGLSDHWRGWSETQNRVIEQIASNEEIGKMASGRLFVVGNHYSQLGDMSHIEFFSTTYVTQAVFRHAAGQMEGVSIHSLTKFHKWRDGVLSDRKFGDQIDLFGTVTIYDSSRNTITRLPVNDLNDYLASLPTEKRHWIQLIEDGPFQKLVIFLMPRLKNSLN